MGSTNRISTSDLVTGVSEKLKLPKTQIKEILGTTFDYIANNVKKGNDVAISDFGVFSKAKRVARNGVNPSTGEKIKIAASKVPKFKASSVFKDALN